MAHHDQINYGIPANLESKYDKHNAGAGHGGHQGGAGGGHHVGGVGGGMHDPLMGGHGGMGGGLSGAQVVKFHDRHLFSNTRICG